MPVEFRSSIRTLTTAISSLGRKVGHAAGTVGKWLNRQVRHKSDARSEMPAGKLSIADKERLLEHIKMLEPGDKWIQSRTVSRLNGIFTHQQYQQLHDVFTKHDVNAAQSLYGQIRRQAPNVAGALLNVMTHAEGRKKNWAQPYPQPGLINSFKLDDHLHRCAQPDKTALKMLKGKGYHVINLRHFHSDIKVAGDKAFGGAHFRVPTKNPLPFVSPVLKEIISSNKKVYIHCLHGSDRTGFMCAAYRMVVQGWTADEAVEEYTKGSFGYHAKAFPELPGMLKKLDVEKIREDIGLKPTGDGKLPELRTLAIAAAQKSEMQNHPPAIEQAKKSPNVPGEEPSG